MNSDQFKQHKKTLSQERKREGKGEKSLSKTLGGKKKITDSLVYLLDRIEKSAFVCPFNTICQDPVSISTCRVKAKLHTPLFYEVMHL